MSYATQQDIVDRYGSDLLLTIADRDRDGVPDAAAVERALGDADELINAHLAEYYELPLINVPALLVTLAVDIAVYKLPELPTEEMRYRYSDALKLLTNIATGKLKLGVSPQPPTSGQGATLVAPPRVFGRHGRRPL